MDYLYPLLASRAVVGELLIETADPQRARAAEDALRSSGLAVAVSLEPPLLQRMVTSPLSWAMFFVAGLAWLSATGGWVGLAAAAAPRLRIWTRLGATPAHAAWRESATAALAWCAAFGCVAALAWVSWVLLRLEFPAWLWPVALGVFALDLVVAVGAFALRTRSLAKLREP
ncbi:hypothetical protein [Propioniciclava soli]|uniref:hypothetical protein n=1 Tax=Propioniciclava soli TaxID=2775081 RepID=UPI001E618428|nr:hypothetical protein [Propioniciclava soli]